MSNLKDETGKRYGPYMVERRVFPNYQPEKSGFALWECKCIYCGAKKLSLVTICDLESIRTFVGYVEMEKNNCKNCKNRHEGCHSNCELYLEFLEENERIKKVRHQETQKQSIKIESCRRRLQACDHHRHWGALGYSRKERRK